MRAEPARGLRSIDTDLRADGAVIVDLRADGAVIVPRGAACARHSGTRTAACAHHTGNGAGFP